MNLRGEPVLVLEANSLALVVKGSDLGRVERLEHLQQVGAAFEHLAGSLEALLVEYDHGYFKIFGIAKNVGESDAKAPLVQLEVWTDDAQRTLLGRGTAAPIGYLGKAMFELMVRVPGERSRVRWQVSSNLPYEVKDTSKK